MAIIPFTETFTRLLGILNIPASQVIVQHLTLWIGFFGAVLATRQNKLLALTQKTLFKDDEKFHFGRYIAKLITFLVLLSLAWGSWDLLKVEIEYPMDIAPKIPRWVAILIMPVGFLLMSIQILLKSSSNNYYRLSFISLAILFSSTSLLEIMFDFFPSTYIGIFVILFALYFGAPIFVGLGGISIFLFWVNFIPISAISAEAYRIVVSPTLPTIPLFTMAGYFLAESKSSKRLLSIFHELFGWVPGGTPIMIILLCGFFTALTGGSGVTILALGGLLFPMLLNEGYSKSFSLGLLTVSGSIGLLFPPSLPAIIYGVTAGVSVKNVFTAGLLPGLLLITLISCYALYQGKVNHIKLKRFSLKSALHVCNKGKWELFLPFIILFGVFGGFTTLVETAAITVLYVIYIEVFIYRDINLKDVPKVIINCSSLIGGVLIILGVAMGLTSYLVDAQIPMELLSWAKSTINNRYIFLLLLNLFLLAVGCLMDIFSAIIVIVPLIAPLGIYFGIDPVHLAIIFIANLELGFLTPPVGMNLFLSAYRFNEPMPKIYKSIFPFFIIKLIAVILITYIPFLTLRDFNF